MQETRPRFELAIASPTLSYHTATESKSDRIIYLFIIIKSYTEYNTTHKRKSRSEHRKIQKIMSSNFQTTATQLLETIRCGIVACEISACRQQMHGCYPEAARMTCGSRFAISGTSTWSVGFRRRSSSVSRRRLLFSRDTVSILR